MKNLLLLITMFLTLSVMAPAVLTAQPTDSLTEQVVAPTEQDSAPATAPAVQTDIVQPTDDGPTLDTLTKWAIPIAVGANWLFTYLLGLFPNFTLFKDNRRRDLSAKALAVALVSGFVLWKFGMAGSTDVLIAFVLSSFGYDKILHPMGLKTKTAATEPQA